MDLGTYIEYRGRPAVRFQRAYPRPAERVWTAITEPDELAHWFPSNVTIEPRAGGTVEFSGDPNMPATTGRVLIFEPPHRLAFSWGGDELHFQIEPTGDDSCELTLINVLEARDAAARNAAGWSVCLAELDKHLGGISTDGPHSASAEPWPRYYEAYLAAGVPSGAAVPGQG
ncbi:MAG: hypothetical protein QOJ62_2287 [Actinomycetota bacterium]|nr:hypothetical protein [Actinomycetota bacterium]